MSGRTTRFLNPFQPVPSVRDRTQTSLERIEPKEVPDSDKVASDQTHHTLTRLNDPNPSFVRFGPRHSSKVRLQNPVHYLRTQNGRPPLRPEGGVGVRVFRVYKESGWQGRKILPPTLTSLGGVCLTEKLLNMYLWSFLLPKEKLYQKFQFEDYRVESLRFSIINLEGRRKLVLYCLLWTRRGRSVPVPSGTDDNRRPRVVILSHYLPNPTRVLV